MLSGIFFIIIIVFIIALFILAGVVNFVLSILRGIFSLGKNNSSPRNTASQSQSSRKKKERIYFNKEEALDVEYEEIKQ
jgi:flagellar basal body-associated protein FliL